MKRALSFFAALAVAVSMMAADYCTVNFSVSPQMTCQNCENKIRSNIRYEKGVKQIDTSLANQIVTVKYDADKTNPQKIAKAFKKIGYEATVVPAGKTVCAERTQCPNAAKQCCGAKKECQGKKKCGGKSGCGNNHHCK